MKSYFYILLFIHLILAVFGVIACHFSTLPSWINTNPMMPLIKTYQQLTETGSGFGFFSPNVASGVRISVVTVDNLGNKITLNPTHDKLPREAFLRIAGSFYRFSQTGDKKKDQTIRRSLSGSLASYYFNKNPELIEVAIKAEEPILPPLGSTKKTTDTWNEIYYAKYQK